MVKLLCLGLFIRWDRADKDGGPLQQGQAAWTWGSVTWHTPSIAPTIRHLAKKCAPADGRHIRFDFCLTGKLVLFRVERLLLKQTKGKFDLFFYLILSLYQLFCFTDLLLWGLDEHVLTITLHVYTINYTVTRDLGSLFTKPWQRSVYSAISPENPTILYLLLLDKNTGITFNFINDGTPDERCRWKSATSVCCIHFSAGSTYSSCLMMLIHTASFTDKCVFGYIHHPEWVFLMSRPLACFTLSTIH